MIYILLAILAGISIVTSRVINFSLADKIGVFQGTFFNYVVGLLFSIIFLVISNENIFIESVLFTLLPWWAYLGGLVGVGVVVLSTYLTPKISTFYLTIFIFLGQLFTGVIIDYFILDEFSIGKIFGGILVLIGVVYNLVLDNKKVAMETSS
ncbi:DMT family transporter [Romboutsia timonensis]|uniref:DMT family transporter n=1 Tax=Romboutsia timonensis TaxID=1776391 RepID=UPI002A74B61F|nr:DMT family transporter [Romboutsia timonensis]MCI6668914.1 DMT family transporter [Romboutsia timonensis]MDY3002418.1 DMT family transporter [Romboutsia timonensis]MDY3960579.1 DMT family transporter [Romboutsia timonensis]